MDKEQIKEATIAVENKSAGDTVAKDVIQAANVVGLTAQVDALNDVKANGSQVAIVDLTLAGNVVGKGDYADLKMVEGVSYGDEIFSVKDTPVVNQCEYANNDQHSNRKD